VSRPPPIWPAGFSQGYFSRAFLAATGETPHQFILTRRLAEARRRLDDGAGDLAQIAVQTSFSSHAHLTTAFGQAFGVTPQAYWRRLRTTACRIRRRFWPQRRKK
jgi:AraC family transcriptional regulator